MPLYEYTCKKCHRDFELLIRGQEAPECPTCGSRQLQKLLSIPAAHTASSKSLPMCPAAPPGGCGSGPCGLGGCGLGPL
jgi:putative FmdB family regulatory protein